MPFAANSSAKQDTKRSCAIFHQDDAKSKNYVLNSLDFAADYNIDGPLVPSTESCARGLERKIIYHYRYRSCVTINSTYSITRAPTVRLLAVNHTEFMPNAHQNATPP